MRDFSGLGRKRGSLPPPPGRAKEQERERGGTISMGRHAVLLLALAAIPGTTGFCVPLSTGKLRASRRPLVAGRTAVFARRQGAETMDAGEDLDQLDRVSLYGCWGGSRVSEDYLLVLDLW